MGGVASAIGNVVGSVVGGFQGAAGTANQYQASGPEQIPGLIASIQQARAGMQPIQENQNALAQMLLAQAQGQGPNPAQAMLNQATNKNIQQAAGMVASQKGVNPGMAARFAGQNAAMANQNAAGQGAVMRAQQQLAAQGQLGGLYGQMGNQNLGQQQLLMQALANQNVGGMDAQRINAGIAGGNAQQRGQMAGQVLGGVGSLLGFGLGKMGGGSSGGQAMAGGPNAADIGSSAMMVAARGGKVPGQASVPGDSPSNDKVHAMLSPGEIIVPRSKAHSAEAAKEFIDHLMKSEGKRKKKGA